MSDNPKPETYGPKCGGVNPQDDAIKCQKQTNAAQANMSGGQKEQVEVPVADNGGVEANSPQNNESNAADLTGGLNQAKADAKYDNQVGDRNVDNSAGAGGGRKRALFEEIEVYEGTLLDQSFTYSSRDPNQKFILPNSGIDLDTLSVHVKANDNSTTKVEYVRQDDLFTEKTGTTIESVI